MSRCKRKAAGWGLVWPIGRPESGSGNAQMREMDRNEHFPMIFRVLKWGLHFFEESSRSTSRARDKTSHPRLQEHPFVRQKLFEYVQYLVKEFDVDAFRLDTAIYMPKEFLSFGDRVFTCLKITPGLPTRGMSKNVPTCVQFPTKERAARCCWCGHFGRDYSKQYQFFALNNVLWYLWSTFVSENLDWTCDLWLTSSWMWLEAIMQTFNTMVSPDCSIFQHSIRASIKGNRNILMFNIWKLWKPHILRMFRRNESANHAFERKAIV